MVKIKNDEKIEDLEEKGLKIIQAKNSYRFSVDSVLLTRFIKIKDYENIIDLGTGSGIIPLLLFGQEKDYLFMELRYKKN